MNSSENSPAPSRKNFEVLPGGAEGGRTLPHSPESEMQLLGAMMLDGGEVVAMAQRSQLRASHFYTAAHRTTCEIIYQMHSAGQPIDLSTVAVELKSQGKLDAIGGYAGLAAMSGSVPTTAQAHYFLDKVIELAILRRVIRQTTESCEAAFEYQGDLLKFTSELAGQFGAIADYVMSRTRRISQAEAAQLAKAEALDVAHGRVDKSRWLHFPSARMDAGFLPIDTRQEDWFNILAAPPSGGKSTQLRLLADHWLQNGKRGVVFLLETSRKRWLQAMAASLAGINLRELEDTRILHPKKFADFEYWLDTIHGWMETTLWVFDDVLTLEAIQRTTRELNRTLREKEISTGIKDTEAQGLHFMIGDYLQIVTTEKRFLKRTEELAHICRSLKQLHRSLDVPGFWGAQITRAARHEGRRPSLSDLGESKALEESADRVLFIHEPTMEDGQGQPADANTITIEVIQRKSRNGPKDVFFEMEFDRKHSRFGDASPKQHPGHPPRDQQPAPQPNRKISKGEFQ